MIQVPVYNQKAEKVGEIELKEELFGVERRPDLFLLPVLLCILLMEDKGLILLKEEVK